MEKNILIFVLTTSLFISCSLPEAGVNVLLGNYDYQKGDYQKAMVRYMDSLGSEKNDLWIRYNLGNVYYSLGEHQAALEEWQRVERSDNDKLLKNSYFNRGILYFNLGKYSQAASGFKQVLKLDSSDLDAKVNLELSLFRLFSETDNQDSSRPDPKKNEPVPVKSDTRRILEYVKQKEPVLWQKNLLKTVSSPQQTDDW